MSETIFSTQSPGIGGTIKLRYSDFVVEEIRADGRKCAVERFQKENAMDAATPIEFSPKPDDRTFSQLHCDLEKMNCDTNFAVQQLARFFQCSKKRIGYAGMKDKRAITCQRISLFNPNEERVKMFRGRMMDLRNFEWSTQRIEIGDLKGNAFTITVRDIGLDEKEAKERMEQSLREIEKKGVANYFGEQRFGGIRNVTHRVGKELILGNTENAVMMYLTFPAEKEPEELKQARKNLLETRDFSKASNEFPNENRFERSMIHHLCKFPKDFSGAFGKLPKAMRYLFTHAYQAQLFNEVIAERLKQGIGLEPIEGDVVEEGFAMGPLLGFESTFAEGKAGEIEKKVLEKEDISLEQFKVKQLAEASSRGGRKRMLLKPQGTRIVGTGKDEFNEGKTKITLYFELEKGAYATTVLAEIMKND